MNTTKIETTLSRADFRELLLQYKATLFVTPHAFNHLNYAQRKLFKEKELKNIILKENPRGIGIQRNGRYAVFYKRKNGFIKIICEIKRQRFEIITFINIERMPNLKRLK